MIKDIMNANESVLPNSKTIEILKENFPYYFNRNGEFDLERFANDDMAFPGYRVYEKRGHKVGKDLYEAKNTTRALSVELKMVARSATISVFKV